MLNETLTINGRVSERTIRYNNTEEETYVEIELTGKESIDVLMALEKLVGKVEAGQFQTDLPVREMFDIARGVVDFPEEGTVLISSDEHARALIHALLKYEPDDADLTQQVRDDVLLALEETPIEFDTESLNRLITTHR